MLGHLPRIFAILTIACGLLLLSQSTAFCQGGTGGGGGGNGGGGGGNGGGGNGNGGDGGTADNPQTGGIEIDANGVLRSLVRSGNAQAVNQQRFAAAQASLNRDLQTPSKLRKISLTRMEREIEKLIAAGKPIPADMQYLAGMTKITHVFFYPETRDIVIAGPAEGYFINADNYVVGMQSGRATLQLQDLIVALRCFAPNGKQTSFITCSIDPTQEGLNKFRNTYQQIARSGQFRPGREAQVVSMFQDSLGMQQITIEGVSTKTHFARVLVEADYEMKLIGIGLKQPPVRITSFIEKASPSSGNKLQRWFFQPDYDCVNVNADNTAMELVGDGVKLVGEDESIVNGQRQGTGSMSQASRIFCNSFTKNYSKLAEVAPIWAELRNVIDMSVVAAYIQKADFYGQAGWQMSTLGDEGAIAVERFQTPTQVAPVANAVWKGQYFMAPIAGGVNIQPRVALNSDRVKVDQEGQIDAVRESVDLSNLADGQWWWD